MSDKTDFRADLTGRVIEALEAGTAPWQKPWDGGAGGFFPVNPVTGKAYRGGNAFALMAAGYDDPRWCTFNQASQNEWKIKKGEKATWVEYWKWSESVEQLDKVTGEVVKEDVSLESPRVFYAKVFNLSQMENVPELVRQQPAWDGHALAEKMLEGSGAQIIHDQADRAFYSVTLDEIHLPARAAFSDIGNFYSTALHELGHWTGHSSRLNREFGTSRGSDLYAKEELRAELASLFLADRLGIPFEVGNHAAYVNLWIETLKNDKNEIFRAAKDAEGIVEYVMGLARERGVVLEPVAEMAASAPVPEKPKVEKVGRTYLNVPFAERGEAKALGARWDGVKGLWYVSAGKDLQAFQQWDRPRGTKEAIDEFASVARDAGLIIDGMPILDGKWHYVQVKGDRDKEKSGSYKGELGDRPNGYVNNFKNTDMSVGWKFDGGGVDKVAAANTNEAYKQAQEKRDQDDLAEKLRVAGMLEKRLAKLPAANANHGYLVAKGVGAYGLLSQGDDLVMPLRDVDGKIWSQQSIKSDGSKLNLKGGRKTGSFHLIGDESVANGVIAVVEGYATGASVFEATRWPVAVAVDSGNLVVVAKALRERYPDAQMVICGDDDRFKRCTVTWTKEGEYIKGHEVPNAGREKALEAAIAVGGRAVFPEFSDGDWKGTDFNDIHAAGYSAMVLWPIVKELQAEKQQGVNALHSSETEQESEMSGFNRNDKVADHYDSNEDFADKLNMLIPDFEYPNWSYKTIGDVLNTVGAQHVKAIENALNGIEVYYTVSASHLPMGSERNFDNAVDAAKYFSSIEADLFPLAVRSTKNGDYTSACHVATIASMTKDGIKNTWKYASSNDAEFKQVYDCLQHAPHEITSSEFAAVATVVKLENHGRQWEVFFGDKCRGFSDAPTEREAVLSFHRAQVNNAIYLNSMDASAAGLPKSSMPPDKVLAEYPDLQEKFGLAHNDEHPNLEIKEPNTERGRYRGVVVDDLGTKVTQHQGKGTAVAHEKDRLVGDVQVGQKVEIGYKEGKGTVRSLEKVMEHTQVR